MRAIAFVAGLCIAAVGAVGVLAPASLLWIARHFVSAGPFYVIAAVRVAFGLVLISAAPSSRAPRALRVLGYAIVIAGVASALAGLLAIERARGLIEWWMQGGSRLVRLTGVPVLALGSFVAYACAPARPRRGG
jgi:hypothetical protein